MIGPKLRPLSVLLPSALALSLSLQPSPATAADLNLGGACCADLEEKVQDLEAASARKGNRRVSLTMSGHVNRALMYWNDGSRSNTYLGLDNSNSSTRFGFSGQARINTAWTAGFNLLIEISGGGRSMIVDQLSEDGPAAENLGSNQDHRLAMRDANWWLENRVLGRLIVGRLTGSGPQGTVDIGGTAVIAPGSVMNGGGLQFRNAVGGTVSGITIANSFDGLDDRSKRQEGVRYVSPSFGGFSFSASVGEAQRVQRLGEPGTATNIGRVWGADVRYATDVHGIQLAAAYGIEQGRAEEVFAPFNATGGNFLSDARNTGLSLSLMHTASGLFFQGHRTKFERNFFDLNSGAPFIVPSTGTARVLALQGGIARNWFGIGNTVAYGEWARSENGAMAFNFSLAPATSKFWGLGIVQNIDAAAMEIYAGYRKHSLDGAGLGLNDIDVITAGARIKF